MTDKEKLSQTMRIDLIPDVPAQPRKGGKKQIVIATPTRKHRRVQKQGTEQAQPSTVSSAESGYEELLQSLYDAAIITDLDGNIVNGNARAVEFLQYSREDLRHLMISDIVSGANESLLQTLSENLQDERFTLIQAYCLRKDSTYFPSEIAVNKLSIGGDHLCFFLRDITLRRQAEEMLRTEHNAIQNARNGIAIISLDSSLEYVNPAVARMWGVDSPEQLVGQDVRVLFADQAKVDEVLNTVLGEQQAWLGELVARNVAEETFELQVSAACNRNSDGEEVGIVFSFVDIGDRKRAEEAERTAERHRVMLESLGAACHHLGQPATVLLANLGIMQTRIDESDELLTELITTSIDAAETLGEILHKLNTVNEYKTTQYLEKPDGSDSVVNRILDI